MSQLNYCLDKVIKDLLAIEKRDADSERSYAYALGESNAQAANARISLEVHGKESK